MLISISCWGDWHTQVFIDHVLPSLAPQMTAGDTLVLHTDTASHERLMPHLPDACDVDYWPGRNLEVDPNARGKAIQNAMWLKDFRTAQKRGDVLAMLWPDVVHGLGTLAHYRALLAAGKRVIYQHFPRVAWESFNDLILDLRTHRDLAAQALAHEHPIMAAHYVSAPRFAAHVDAVIWRTPGGTITRLLGAGPVVVDPAAFDLDGKTHLVQDPGDKLAFITDSDDAIGLSLAPLGHEPQWTGDGPFSIDAAQEWQAKWGGPGFKALAAQSYRVHAGDIVAADWDGAEAEAQAIVGAIFRPMAVAAE